MPRPARPPIGLALARAAKVTSTAFDDVMGDAGGSMPMWQVLLSLTTHQGANQRQLADAVGIQGATLTHHLNAMEASGLVTRRRDPGNRRVHIVELTEAGEAAFGRLTGVAVAFDERLRAGITDEDAAVFGRVLEQLVRNAAR